MKTQMRYEPMPGEDIRNACRRAVEIAAKCDGPVAFTFNDTEVTVRPGEHPSLPYARWNLAVEAQAEAYRNSPEGKAAAEQAEWSRQDHQRRTGALMHRLPESVKDLRELVVWCVAMSEAADHVGVLWSAAIAARTIEVAGYIEDAHVGVSPKTLDASPQMMGEYLIGQALAFMKRGMPPHPIIGQFAEEAGFLT